MDGASGEVHLCAGWGIGQDWDGNEGEWHLRPANLA
jgi:hypothetical protein